MQHGFITFCINFSTLRELQKTVLSFQQREERVAYKETRIILALDFPRKTKETKTALKENNVEPRVLYSN